MISDKNHVFGETVAPSSSAFQPNQSGQEPSQTTFDETVTVTDDTEYRGVVLPEDINNGNRMNPDHERHLTELAQSRTQESSIALAELFTHYRPGIIGAVLKNVPLDDRDDVLQQAITNALLGIGKIEQRDNLFPWFCTIARNAWHDQIRRANAGTRPKMVFCSHDGENGALYSEASSIDVEEEVVRGLLVGQLLGALGTDHRDVVQRVNMQGATFREYSEEAGVPLGTAKSRGFYALRRMKEAFGDDSL